MKYIQGRLHFGAEAGYKTREKDVHSSTNNKNDLSFSAPPSLRI